DEADKGNYRALDVTWVGRRELDVGEGRAYALHLLHRDCGRGEHSDRVEEDAENYRHDGSQESCPEECVAVHGRFPVDEDRPERGKGGESGNPREEIRDGARVLPRLPLRLCTTPWRPMPRSWNTT